MLKTFSVCCFSLAALFICGAPGAQAQFLAPMPQTEPILVPVPTPAPAAEPPLPLPDEIRTTLMVRNAIVALSQANLTGNYAVLRDMGTPNFQITNSTARLAEIFSTLRARRIDLAPVMFFTPKITSGPAFQDGQVLHVAGYFPTSPEQVNFELAFQHFGDQWMIAGIAVNVAPPSEGQANAGGETQSASDIPPPKSSAKPVRIDLSQPAPAAAAPAAPPKKPVARRTKPAPSQKTAAAQSNAAPAAPAEPAAPASPAPAPTPPAEQPKSTEFGAGWNPFGH